MVETAVETAAIGVVMDLAGPTFIPRHGNDIVALIEGVQLVHGKLGRMAFEASKIGYLLEPSEFAAQPPKLIQSYLSKGLSVEARSLLLEQTLKPAVRKLLEAIEA